MIQRNKSSIHYFTKELFKYTHTIFILAGEAATGDVLSEKVFLEISQNSQGNTCARVSFLIKLQAKVYYAA